MAAMAHQHLPVGGRSGRRGDVVEMASSVGPAAPEDLSPRGAEIWRELWSSPSARLWTESDAGLVRRLVVLRERLEVDLGAPAALYTVALRLETSLGLTPAARAALGVVVEDESPRPRRNGRRRLSARERDRILRG
jgi:hypothetical protein